MDILSVGKQRSKPFRSCTFDAGVHLVLGWGIWPWSDRMYGERKFAPSLNTGVQTMAAQSTAESTRTREQRIETIMNELRPTIEETVRQLVEQAVDVAEAEEFGAIDFEFRDAGLQLANEVRQARVASRKKRGT